MDSGEGMGARESSDRRREGGCGGEIASSRSETENLELQAQYFGIIEGPYRKRLNRWHHAISQITKNPSVWLEQLEYLRRVTRTHLKLAEAA